MTGDLILKATLNIILLIIFLFIFLKRNNIYNKLESKEDNINRFVRKYLEKIIKFCPIRYNSFTTTIMLPLLFVSLLFLYLTKNVEKLRFEDLSPLNILNSMILAPISEEIMFRGIILGAIIIIISNYFYKKFGLKRERISEILIDIVSVVIVAILFSFSHEGRMDIRYVGGFIFGLVYIIDKKNLSSAIVAHMYANLLSFLAPII